MKNILITGGAGFIATHLIEELIKNPQNNIIAVDNLSMCSDENISQFFGEKNFKFQKIELANSNEVEKLFESNNFQRVYHLAANSDISKSFIEPSIDFKNTFITTWNILESIRLNKVNELIFASSSAIYGDTEDYSISEDFGPIFPISHYGAGKLASEAFISSYSHNYNINTLIVRFPNVIGEYSTHGVIYDFVKKLKLNPHELTVLGNGRQEKSYLYVKDLLNAIAYAWESKKKPLDAFNIGGMDTCDVTSIAKIVVKYINPNATISYTGGDRGWKGDVPKFSYDISKILDLGWSPKLTSKKAIERTVKFLISKNDNK